MKKLLTITLALAMLLGCIAMFASCGAKPKLDLEDAADALEDEDYTVTYEDEMDSFPNIEEYLTAYNDDDSITMIKFADTQSAKLYYEKLKMEYKYEMDEIELEIKSAKHTIKKYEDDLKNDEIDEIEDEIKDLEKELKEMKKDRVFGRSGKIVWFGTESAVKDTK